MERQAEEEECRDQDTLQLGQLSSRGMFGAPWGERGFDVSSLWHSFLILCAREVVVLYRGI